MSDEFKGKGAIVTGASRGIGAAVAVALARAGVARIAIHYNTHREGAEQVLGQLRAAGAEGSAIQADLSEDAGIDRFLEAVREPAAGCDILVNNAGSLLRRSPLSDCPPAVYDRVMNLNVKSVWRITQLVSPHMVARRSGSIVNVGSIAARNGGGHGATIYAAAKAAVSAMTRGMAKELAPSGVRVNAISPGTVDNHFHEEFSTREMLDSVAAATPLGRLATNEDMADAVVFLCSEASRYIVGQTIEINGGMYMI